MLPNSIQKDQDKKLAMDNAKQVSEYNNFLFNFLFIFVLANLLMFPLYFCLTLTIIDIQSMP